MRGRRCRGIKGGGILNDLGWVKGNPGRRATVAENTSASTAVLWLSSGFDGNRWYHNSHAGQWIAISLVKEEKEESDIPGEARN
jgi:hypothetical protein